MGDWDNITTNVVYDFHNTINEFLSEEESEGFDYSRPGSVIGHLMRLYKNHFQYTKTAEEAIEEFNHIIFLYETVTNNFYFIHSEALWKRRKQQIDSSRFFIHVRNMVDPLMNAYMPDTLQFA